MGITLLLCACLREREREHLLYAGVPTRDVSRAAAPGADAPPPAAEPHEALA